MASSHIIAWSQQMKRHYHIWKNREISHHLGIKLTSSSFKNYLWHCWLWSETTQELKGTRMVILSFLQKRTADQGGRGTILFTCPKWQSGSVASCQQRSILKKDWRSKLPAGSTEKTRQEPDKVAGLLSRKDPQEGAGHKVASSARSNLLPKPSPAKWRDMSKPEGFSSCHPVSRLYWTQE